MKWSKLIASLLYIEKWNIGITRQPLEELLCGKPLRSIMWLKEDGGHCFSADPFGVVRDGQVDIYYEHLHRWQGRGKICRIRNFDFSTRQTVKGFFPSGIHLSYPYLYTEAGITYCIPETAQAKEIALYVVNNIAVPHCTLKRVLVRGQAFLDSSLVRWQHRYWLFTSVLGRPGLLIYSADSLDGEFVAHTGNPIRCSPQETRSAGHLFIHGGSLYRPAQDPSNGYGSALVLHRITELTTTGFRSEPVSKLLPDVQYPSGLHTLSLTSDVIVVDGKRMVLSPYKAIMKLIESGMSFMAAWSRLLRRAADVFSRTRHHFFG